MEIKIYNKTILIFLLIFCSQLASAQVDKAVSLDLSSIVYTDLPTPTDKDKTLSKFRLLGNHDDVTCVLEIGYSKRHIFLIDNESKKVLEKINLSAERSGLASEQDMNPNRFEGASSIDYLKGNIYIQQIEDKEAGFNKKNTMLISKISYENRELSLTRTAFPVSKNFYKLDFEIAHDQSMFYCPSKGIINLETKKSYELGILLINLDPEVTNIIPTAYYNPDVVFLNGDPMKGSIITSKGLIKINPDRYLDNASPYFQISMLDYDELKYTIADNESTKTETAEYDKNKIFKPNDNGLYILAYSELLSHDENGFQVLAAAYCDGCSTDDRFDYYLISIDNNLKNSVQHIPHYWTKESPEGTQDRFQIDYFKSQDKSNFSSKIIQPYPMKSYPAKSGNTLGEIAYYSRSSEVINIHSTPSFTYSNENVYIIKKALYEEVSDDQSLAIYDDDDTFIYGLANFPVPKVKKKNVKFEYESPQVLQYFRVDKKTNKIFRTNILGTFTNSKSNIRAYPKCNIVHKGKVSVLVVSPDNKMGFADLSW